MQNDLPFFSIVVPTYNRPDNLSSCLQAFTNLAYPNNRFEVIVVDDGSSVSPESIAAQFRDSIALNLIRQSNSGPATARNTGADNAKGKYLAFTDDDCTPASDWLMVLAKHFTETPSHLIGGKVINSLPDNLYSVASELFSSYVCEYYNLNPNRAQFFRSSNMVLPTEGFKEIKGFDTSFRLAGGEDFELCYRWFQHGLALKYVSEAIVYHVHALSFKKYCHQHFTYGRGAYYFRQRRQREDLWMVNPNAPPFYRNLIRYPFKKFSKSQAILLVILFKLKMVLHRIGFVWELLKRS